MLRSICPERLQHWTPRRALALVLLLLVVPQAPGAEPAGLSAAINTAGRQRMLTQRIVKAYCLQGLGNENRGALVQRFEAIERFEAQLAEIQAFAADHPSVQRDLEQVRELWRAFEPLASAEEVSREGAQRLLALDGELLDAADNVVTALEQLSTRTHTRLVNVAGRQRMLSQRLVKAYLFLAWGIEPDTVVNQFVETWNEFEISLAELTAFEGNTAALARELDDAAEQWTWFQSALSLHREHTYFPGIVDNAGEKILSIMENVTRLYERLASERAPS